MAAMRVVLLVKMTAAASAKSNPHSLKRDVMIKCKKKIIAY